LYSGADNIIYSLWKVPDKQTSELMVDFYKYIAAGKNYSEALREAKLNFIKNEVTARPRTWACFVMIGG
jgi:CHAT domain-containing protein